MVYAKELLMAIKEGDLPISREALLSSRQQKPLFSHTPGRRALNGRQTQHQQTAPSELSATNERSGVQEAFHAPEVKTLSGSKYLCDSPERWGDAAVVGAKTTEGSMLTDFTSYIHSTSNNTALASKPQPATTGPAAYNCGSKSVSYHAALNLPEDPFAPTPCKVKSSQSYLPAQPTSPSLPMNSPTVTPLPPPKAAMPLKRLLPPNEVPVAKPPPPKALPPSKRSLPFSATPLSEPPANLSPPAFADSPLITTPHGVFLNRTFKAHTHPSTFSAGYQPSANFQTSGTGCIWPACVHAPLPWPSHGQVQIAFANHHTYSQASVPFGNPSHAHLPYRGNMQSHAEAYVAHKPGLHPVAASYTHCDNTARRDSSAARFPSARIPCSRSQNKPRVHADCPKTESRDESAEIVASTSAGDNKDHAIIFQAQKLSSWCHVKHSRGETPELSRNEVKALVQAQIEAGKPMRTAWYRPAGSELSSGPSIASTGSTVNVPTKAFVLPRIIFESNISVSSDAPSSSQAGTGGAGQRISTGVFQPATF